MNWNWEGTRWIMKFSDRQVDIESDNGWHKLWYRGPRSLLIGNYRTCQEAKEAGLDMYHQLTRLKEIII